MWFPNQYWLFIQTLLLYASKKINTQNVFISRLWLTIIINIMIVWHTPHHTYISPQARRQSGFLHRTDKNWSDLIKAKKTTHFSMQLCLSLSVWANSAVIVAEQTGSEGQRADRQTAASFVPPDSRRPPAGQALKPRGQSVESLVAPSGEIEDYNQANDLRSPKYTVDSKWSSARGKCVLIWCFGEKWSMHI